jgi:ABC-type nitrate/sulfonate/bicarbonate transport system permease component
VRPDTLRQRIAELGGQALLLLTLLACWQAAAILFPAPYLPRLERIALSFWNLVHGELLVREVLPSAARVGAGLAVGIVLGAAIGLAIGYFRSLDPWLRPILEFVRALPAVTVLPAALLLLGSTDAMRVSIIAFGCTPPVLLAAIDGARRVDELLLDTARVSGLGPAATVARVIVPAALPQVFAGIRVALGVALIMMVISELIAANNGLGAFIQRNQRLFNTANVYAGVLVIGLLAWLFTAAMLELEKRVLRWHRGWRGVME